MSGMISPMVERRWFGQGSRNVLVLVVLVMTTSGLTLPHWHTEWNGCELCHIRYSPNLDSPIADSPAVTLVTERDWLPDDRANELDTCVLTRSSRAPPAFSPVTT